MRLTVYAYWKQWEWEKEPHIELSVIDLSTNPNKDFVRLPAGKFKADFDIRPFDHAALNRQQIATLRAKQGVLMAEITDIDRRVQELLAIEHMPEGTTS